MDDQKRLELENLIKVYGDTFYTAGLNYDMLGFHIIQIDRAIEIFEKIQSLLKKEVVTMHKDSEEKDQNIRGLEEKTSIDILDIIGDFGPPLARVENIDELFEILENISLQLESYICNKHTIYDFEILIIKTFQARLQSQTADILMLSQNRKKAEPVLELLRSINDNIKTIIIL